jgi:hypothetical protein
MTSPTATARPPSVSSKNRTTWSSRWRSGCGRLHGIGEGDSDVDRQNLDRPSSGLRFGCGGGLGTSRGVRRRHVRPDRRAHARFFGTPQYIIGQSIVVIAWVILKAFAFAGRWDPYPFILLNLVFSLQAADAAPRRVRRIATSIWKRAPSGATKEHVRYAEDRVAAIKVETDKLTGLLESNTELTREDKELTEQVADLTREIHALLTRS